MTPNFIATCTEGEEVVYYGAGVTANEAFAEFMSAGIFEDYCEHYEVAKGVFLEVYIYTTRVPNDSGEGAEHYWEFVIDKKIATRTAKAI